MNESYNNKRFLSLIMGRIREIHEANRHRSNRLFLELRAFKGIAKKVLSEELYDHIEFKARQEAEDRMKNGIFTFREASHTGVVNCFQISIFACAKILCARCKTLKQLGVSLAGVIFEISETSIGQFYDLNEVL